MIKLDHKSHVVLLYTVLFSQHWIPTSLSEMSIQGLWLEEQYEYYKVTWLNNEIFRNFVGKSLVRCDAVSFS